MGAYKINPADNVLVALSGMKSGEIVDSGGVAYKVLNTVVAGHKFAAKDIPKGGHVVKYGRPIGRAVENISAGEFVHSHNLREAPDSELSHGYEPKYNLPVSRAPGSFMGFRREDGRVGVRNEIWIIPTVSCVNEIGALLARRAEKSLPDGVDGVYCFGHPYGCSPTGDVSEPVLGTLAGLINHPNAAGVLLLGLGCEDNTVAAMRRMLGGTDSARIKSLVCQSVEDELEAGLAMIDELAGFAAGFSRVPVPMSELVVGLRSGGDDGLTCATANPLAGEFSDMLALSQMTPGPIAINAATYVGYTVGGISGSALATFMVCLAPFLIMYAVCRFFMSMKDHPGVIGAMALLRPAVVGLVLAAFLTLLNKENFVDWKSGLVFAAAFIASAWLKIHPIAVMVAAGIFGWFAY